MAHQVIKKDQALLSCPRQGHACDTLLLLTRLCLPRHEARALGSVCRHARPDVLDRWGRSGLSPKFARKGTGILSNPIKETQNQSSSLETSQRRPPRGRPIHRAGAPGRAGGRLAGRVPHWAYTLRPSPKAPKSLTPNRSIAPGGWDPFVPGPGRSLSLLGGGDRDGLEELLQFV